MDIQKDINKEVLKSDEEKVEDLAKDAEDLEKAVEKDIEDKVEKVEEVNDAKAEPIKSDIVASKKEFKDEQERDKEVVPGLEKAELEEGLTEAKKTLDDVYEDPGLESIWETNWKELVPTKGKAETPIGEVMRCFAKVSHEYFQNGSILGKGYNNKSNYDAANDMDRALQANGLNDNELCRLWDKIWATRSEAAYDHYLAEFYEKFINKYLKNGAASDKEFKEEQKQEDVEFPEVKKSEFVTEKLKPFTEKLELNEAAETQTEIKELLSDYLLNELEESEFMDNLAWRAEKEVSGYNHDWCAEEASPDYKEKEYEFIDELVEDLMANCPLEESLKEDLMSSSWGSNFQSDVYNALADIAFKYYKKNINITDDDWNDAIEWFMTHFFESDDNPFYESLEEAVSPDLINAIMWNYGCSKTEANKQAKGMSEERKKLLIQTFEDNAKKSFYSESLKEDTAAKHDLDILKPYLPSDFQYRQFYSVILVRKDIGTFMEALRKDGWKLISYPTATELETENNVFVGSAIFSKDNLNIYVWESESPKVCYVRLLDKSLDESKLDEAIPREVAQALKNSSGLEIKNSGGAYYRIPGSTDSKYSNLDPKTALNNSKVDYANAEFNKISKEEAFNLFKTEPQNLLLIVKDYGRNSDKAIWFDENGNRSGRVETVPLEIAPVKRDGTAIRDTKYMSPKQLIGCASACYWTNQREVLRDPDIEKERHQNPESKYYTGDSVSDVVKATSPKYRDSYGIDNRDYRGVEMPSSYNWRPYNEREYQRIKTDLNTWQTRLDSGELNSSDRLYALRKIDDLENKLKELEKNRSKYYNDIKDYKANVRNLTMLKSKDYLKKLLDLRAKVKDSDDELRSAEARLATVKNQGGTWRNDYDRRQVTRYESQIEELKAQIARYQKYIEDLNAKLSSQQVSEEDAREIANAEADVNRIKSEIEDSKNELNAVLNRARARRQQNTESLEEDLKVTIDFASFEPWGRAEDAYNRIKDAGKLDEADAILEELYPEGISEDSLNAILAHEPEWLLNELGLADEEEVAMLDLDEE